MLGALYDYDYKLTTLVKGTTSGDSPTLTRLEISVIRKSDSKLLAYGVTYSRSGGDFFNPSYQTMKRCSEAGLELPLLKRLFIKEY